MKKNEGGSTSSQPSGRRIRRTAEDEDRGELSKEWVKAVLAREINAITEKHRAEVNDLNNKLEVTKQTLVVTIGTLLATRQVLEEVAAVYENSGATLAFDTLKEVSALTSDERVALSSYVKRFNNLSKDAPVKVSDANAKPVLTLEEAELEAANRRMQVAYSVADNIEKRRNDLRARVRSRVAARDTGLSEQDILLARSVEP